MPQGSLDRQSLRSLREKTTTRVESAADEPLQPGRSGLGWPETKKQKWRHKTRIHLPSLPVDRQGMPHRCLDTEPVQGRPENAVIVQPIDQDLVERCLLGLDTIHYAL
jgi:hypothetical protein